MIKKSIYIAFILWITIIGIICAEKAEKIDSFLGEFDKRELHCFGKIDKTCLLKNLLIIQDSLNAEDFRNITLSILEETNAFGKLDQSMLYYTVETEAKKTLFRIETKDKYKDQIASIKWVVEAKEDMSIREQLLTTITSDAPLSDEDKRIITQLRDSHELSLKPCRVVVHYPTQGAGTEKIYKINSWDGRKVIGKVLSHVDLYFQQEVDRLRSVQLTLESTKEIFKEGSEKLPIIMNLLGEMIVDGSDQKKGVILLSRAYGETIYDILEAIDQKSSIDGTKSMVIKIFRSIGEQLGSLDSILFKKFKKILINTDQNAGNLMFSMEKEQLYWIDTERLEWKSIEKIVSLNIGYKLILDHIRSMPSMSKKEDAHKYFQIAQNRWLAIKNIYEGYSASLKKNSLDNIDVIEEYNSCMKSSPEKKNFEKFGMSIDLDDFLLIKSEEII